MLMDEPFSAVDPVVRDQLQDEFLRLQGELGKTIVFVTHDIDEAIKLGDQVAVLRVGGRLAQLAEPADLLAHPADDFVADFVGRDRGYRALGFQEAPRPAAAPRSRPSLLGATPDDVGRDADGWLLVRRRRPAAAGLGRAARVGRPRGRPRRCCTAAAPSPATTGPCAPPRRRAVLAEPPRRRRRRRRASCAAPSAPHEVLTAIEHTERPERDERPGRRPVRDGRPPRDLARRPHRRHPADAAPVSTPLPRRASRWSSGSSSRSRSGWLARRWSRLYPALITGDRAALHDPVAGAVRPHAARSSAPRSSTRSTSSSP